MSLGGPAVAGWVAAIGTTEMRELRGRIPWYGSLANHAGAILPAIVGGVVQVWLLVVDVGARLNRRSSRVCRDVVAERRSVGLNVAIASGLLALRTGQSFASVCRSTTERPPSVASRCAPWVVDGDHLLHPVVGDAPVCASAVHDAPASQRFVEMREMFTQTIGALAEAVDKRDPFTARHCQRVKEIAVDIGRVMRVSDAELEALEWGGLLHDVGKIGVPTRSAQAGRLTREERMIMNAHPVLGAQIIGPVTKLAPELPIIRHHHEWYNGSGYPDRLIGDEIPKLARILHVADAFEAMTAARPYRMTPLTPSRRWPSCASSPASSSIPQMVDAFVRTVHAEGVPDPGRPAAPRQIPLIAQAADRMTVPRVDATATTPAERV